MGERELPTTTTRVSWVGDGDRDQLASLVGLVSLRGMSPRRLWSLLESGGPADAWQRVLAGRVRPSGRASDPSPGWQAQAETVVVDDLLDQHAQADIEVVAFGAERYPRRLLDDPDPPAVMFSHGRPRTGSELAVAIVGTRRCTPYGRSVARDLGVSLADRGIDVISGLAHGIDAAVHAGALEVDPARCIAVVANGLDTVYPRGNRVLWRAVAEGGTLVTEWPLGVAATPWRFPARNRIIAGLAAATVVVESAVTGGSMHTVDEALRRARPVFAVPGSIRSPLSTGTHRLIADGAHVLASIEEFVDALAPATAAAPGPRPAPVAASWVLDAIGWEPLSVDDLIDAADRPIDAVLLDVERLVAAGVLERVGATVRRVR